MQPSDDFDTCDVRSKFAPEFLDVADVKHSVGAVVGRYPFRTADAFRGVEQEDWDADVGMSVAERVLCFCDGAYPAGGDCI